MNGAESLVRSLVAAGVKVCFANPGTSEMHFVSALDRVSGLRPVLVLHETVATGAADGYWRMTGTPAATLLHLGPGLSNGLSNLHNARKAGSGVVNIVGEHATWHLAHDAPLASDIEGLARPLSHFVATSRGTAYLGHEAVSAVAEAARGRIATLILPGDAAWSEGGVVADAGQGMAVARETSIGQVDADAVEAAAQALRAGGARAMLLLGGAALRGRALTLAGQIAGRTGARLASQFFSARIERGAGRVAVWRIPYFVAAALEALQDFREIVTVETREPVAFFAYPGKPSQLKHPDARLTALTPPGVPSEAMLEALAEAVGAGPADAVLQPADAGPQSDAALPSGPLNPAAIARILAAAIPENAIVVDESLTTGRDSFGLTAGARPHDWLQNMGGSIGYGLPVSVGAALACPDRPVLALSGDGCAMYTLQALWTQAREGLNVTTLVFANRAYQILRTEFDNVGAPAPGPRAMSLLRIDDPVLDFVSLARGMGVEAVRAEDCEGLIRALRARETAQGPGVIEVVL